jgi:RNA polymerase sigma-70 factor, ECF subfamily
VTTHQSPPRLTSLLRQGAPHQERQEHAWPPHRINHHAQIARSGRCRAHGSADRARLAALAWRLFRAWRGLRRFGGQGQLRAWLYKVATNVCLDALARPPKRHLQIDRGRPAGPNDGPGQPLPESTWVEPYPDEEIGLADGYAAPEARYEQREAVELSFIAALQHLSANQRAVLILRDVLGFSSRKTAKSLETTVASVNSALQRARNAVDERMPELSQQVTLRALDDERVRAVVEQYIAAW